MFLSFFFFALTNSDDVSDLRRDELYLDLNHNSVAERVIRIIGEHIPEVTVAS